MTTDTFTDLSHLPTATRNGRDGLLPDEKPRFAQVLVEAWADDHDEDKATALGTPFRHSDAGKCARALSYTAAGVAPSDPMDLSGVFNVTLGSLLHDQWQAALVARFPDAEIEVTCATVGADGSGHIDAVVRGEFCPAHPAAEQRLGDGSTLNGACLLCDDPLDQRTIAIELKTIGGYGYKAAIGTRSKGTPAEGPRTSHLLQAALNGAAVDADEVVVVYLAKEALSVNVAERWGVDTLGRFCCEWTFTRDQYLPLAEKEAERVAGVLSLLEGGELARRVTPEMPRRAEIIDPSSGAWQVLDDEGKAEDAGSCWECRYCKFQSLCVTTEPGRIPLTEVLRATA